MVGLSKIIFGVQIILSLIKFNLNLVGIFLSISKRHLSKLIDDFLRYLDKSFIIFAPIMIG